MRLRKNERDIMKGKISFSDFQKVRQMSLNEFNRFMKRSWDTAYESGKYDGKESIKKQEHLRESIAYSDQELFDILCSISGIGKIRARKIIDRLLPDTEGNDEK